MTPPCTGEPISWLRLERLALGELDATAAAAANAHLDACGACRAAFDRIRADAVALPPLPAPVAAPPRSWFPRWTWAAASLAAAAAMVLLWIGLRDADPGGVPGAVVGVKGGGALTLSLVRERDGVVTLDATSYRDGDRFKVRITCDRAVAATADVVVYQTEHGRRAASFPLPVARLSCGNEVVLPGAFHLDGDAPALVCLAVTEPGEDGDRRAMMRAPPPHAACRTLAAE
jgi:hypothetical protein